VTARSTDEVCDLAGITPRQLDHWHRRGYIAGAPPFEGTGVPRHWSYDAARQHS
jgi:hypothetical protein